MPEQTAFDIEMELTTTLLKTTRDPYAFVMIAFEWGKNELAGIFGPEDWQKELLIKIRDGLLTIEQAILICAATGHGVGKSAFIGWIILWSISTHEDTRGVVTANTATQLQTKTWPELTKWYNLFIAKHWFTLTATSIYSIDKAHEKTWRFDMIPWSLHRTEAFAGMHNKGKRLVVVFDEASAIPDQIWEVTEGALTDANTQILWIVFGNPTRGSGRFHACFHRLRHRWFGKQVDGRTVSLTNKKQIDQWAKDYGEDSDFFKVRVRGEFPSSTDMQFIPSEYVENARGRHLLDNQFNFAAKIIGVDGAWSGTCAIYLRQGLMVKKLMTLHNIQDDFVIAGHVAKFEDQEQADAVFVDMGYGTGIVSAGKQMKRKWQLVPFGGLSTDVGYLNKGTDMWRLMKEWLKEGGSIPDDPMLAEQLTNREHYVVAIGKNMGKINLETKDQMLLRGVGSPNDADAIALTFAQPVKNKSQRQFDTLSNPNQRYDPLSTKIQQPVEYNPLSPLSQVL